MPIYEYRCASCGEVTEVLQKLHDKPLKRCAKCSGGLEKLISRSSFHLKGTGWYVTDYARKGKGGGESGESSSKSDEPSSRTEASSASGSPAAGAAKEGDSKDKSSRGGSRKSDSRSKE